MMAPLARKLLLACAITVLGVFALLVLSDHGWTPPAPHPIDVSSFGLVELRRGLRPVSRLDEIAARPLFAQSRRPPPVAEVSPAASRPVEPIQDAKVLGLFGRQDAWGVILSMEGKVKRVGPGEKIGQWALLRVDGNDILFDDGAGAQTTLKIVHLPQASAPPASAKPALALPAGSGPAEDSPEGNAQPVEADAKPASPQPKRQ
jgi:hypothetical protein